jgi:hypothetical protein
LTRGLGGQLFAKVDRLGAQLKWFTDKDLREGGP